MSETQDNIDPVEAVRRHVAKPAELTPDQFGRISGIVDRATETIKSGAYDAVADLAVKVEQAARRQSAAEEVVKAIRAALVHDQDTRTPGGLYAIRLGKIEDALACYDVANGKVEP